MGNTQTQLQDQKQKQTASQSASFNLGMIKGGTVITGDISDISQVQDPTVHMTSEQVAQAQAEQKAESGIPMWVIIVGIVLIVGVIIFILVMRARSRAMMAPARVMNSQYMFHR